MDGNRRTASARTIGPAGAGPTDVNGSTVARALMMRGSRAFSCNLFRTKKGKLNVLFDLKYGFSTWGLGH